MESWLDPEVLTIEDIIEALFLSAADKTKWWPPEDTLSISLDAGKVTVRRRSLSQPVVLDIEAVKKEGVKVGLDIW